MLCPGDSVWIDGVWYGSPDAFAVYLQTAAGCDSILGVTISVDEMYQKEEKYILCPGDSVQIDGVWHDVSAVLTFLHPAIDGCDTLYTVVIETVPSPPYPQQEINCDTAAIILTLDTSGPWQVQWDNGETGSPAMYFNGTTAVLHLYADPGCVHIEQIALLPIPNIDALPVFDDITTTPGTPVVINSGLDPAAWTVTWSTPADLSCSHCATTELTTHHDASVEILMEHLSGCVFTAQFLVSVEDADGTGVYIPNVFTPNGDGINDTWMIFPADETLTFDEVLIFDRWGDLVAGWQNTAMVSWDGTFRGKPMNPGVFVYVVRYTDRNNVQRLLIGDVTLLR
jgi:gliding motility-associated-like protein